MALDENSAVKSAKRLVMSTINKYVKTSKISEAKFREIVKYFAFDLDAQTIALLTKLNRNTVNRYLSLIRQRIADMCEEASPFQGEIEVDESYCGAKRIKGKRGRGAGRKTPVFGILQCKGSVYTEIVPDCARKTIQAIIIRGKVEPNSFSYIQIVGEAITVWLTGDTKSITVSIMETMNVPEGRATSMALNLSGRLQNGG